MASRIMEKQRFKLCWYTLNEREGLSRNLVSGKEWSQFRPAAPWHPGGITDSLHQTSLVNAFASSSCTGGIFSSRFCATRLEDRAESSCCERIRSPGPILESINKSRHLRSLDKLSSIFCGRGDGGYWLLFEKKTFLLIVSFVKVGIMLS